jgi:hypothetical protein
MGMLLKSAIGLGAVYIAMFAPAIRSADMAPVANLGPAANLCAAAARAQLAGDASLRAQWSAAGCAVKLVEAQRAVSAAPPKAAPPPPKPAPPARKAVSGMLTEADLAEPWFGPARPLRKSAGRG